MIREIKYRGYTISQASNNHVAIFQNSKMIFHSQISKKLSDEELKKQVDFFLDILSPLIDNYWESEAKDAK